MRSLKLVLRQLLPGAIASILLFCPAPTVAADVFKEMTRTGSYGEVGDDLKNAIINRGFVVD